MPHAVLLRDSIFDNAADGASGEAVIDAFRPRRPPAWSVTLLAVDVSTARELAAQRAPSGTATGTS